MFRGHTETTESKCSERVTAKHEVLFAVTVLRVKTPLILLETTKVS